MLLIEPGPKWKIGFENRKGGFWENTENEVASERFSFLFYSKYEIRNFCSLSFRTLKVSYIRTELFVDGIPIVFYGSSSRSSFVFIFEGKRRIEKCESRFWACWNLADSGIFWNRLFSGTKTMDSK
ncbi:hypothetical protein LEP1GSC188_4086 [Leptospira weilii serovar Topaz str. LT2116]|uniref:Uncharacterized protein n=1 Tax=Leptospira weilii serovar Topaz str. LT2116 TaxID=1088540 RepID=M3H5W5_9LEPT|nr:hypothetical protein LEP1GSC188_4086 [Leptospira weilii serovar Topaz str. LT2116]